LRAKETRIERFEATRLRQKPSPPFRRRRAQSTTASPLHNTWHASLDARFAQTRHQKRRPLFQRRPEDGEEFDAHGLSKRLFDQVDGDAPPGQDGADDPEVAGHFHPRADAAAVGEEAAGDGGADGESRENRAEDQVSGGGCNCLIEENARVSYWFGGFVKGLKRLTPDQVKKERTTNHEASSGKCS
jgi:hypothetical protein